ncbi:hypothetical protein PCASD_08372 [Puccinia coronata f. sp. avenae]|uniref:Wax synthase domain-containing protein n=1 Tax=Puccinia coronata f. sp. avenae TaxID=200324 RepID=A0A2N5TFT5_9BASI|nr:hypothetical protein PCASD_08372 [Puccinia coronata f. sp. avenae]
MENMNGTSVISSSLNSFASPWWFATNSSSSSWAISTSGELARPGSTTSLILEAILVMSLMSIQSVLLHPKFEGSTASRLARLSLGPIIVGWWFYFPFRLPVQPLETRNILPGFAAGMMILKSLEWTFVAGPYHLRTLKTIDGVPFWVKEPAPMPSSCGGKSDWRELALWTALQFQSFRGLRWSWGPSAPIKGNQSTFTQSMLELARLQLVMLPCLAFLIHAQDRSTNSFDSMRALLDLGVPSFPGLRYVASGFHSICAMLVISSSIEMMSLIPVLSTYLLHPLAQKLGLSSQWCDLVNPQAFPPQFGPILEFSSLAHFWGKTWHQRFRRPFLFCGGKPAMALARFFGASPQIQKACGAMGVFVISGLLHEYPMHVFERAPHPHPRGLFKTFPGSFLFFFVQSFGLILEPMIIPYIPKRLGGAKLWTACFLFLTAPLFTRDICRPTGMFTQYHVPQEWTWLHILIPAPYATHVLSPK